MSTQHYPVAVLANHGHEQRATISFYTSLAKEAEAKGLDWFVFDNTQEEPYVWEPQVLLAHLAAQTEQIGLGVPVSTVYNEPYHLARILATIDHFSKGRASWQAVLHTAFDRDAQYVKSVASENQESRASELVSVVQQLWDSWEDDAVENNKASGQFLNTKKIRHINHKGEHFKVRGPNPVPRPPQGHPVSYAIVQREVHGPEAWAEVIFLTGTTAQALEHQYKAVQALRKQGSSPKYFVPKALADEGLSIPFDGLYIEANEVSSIAQQPASGAKTLRERLSLARPAVEFAKSYS